MAAPAAPFLRDQHLQPRLSRRDARGSAAADAQRLPPRWLDDPPLLGLRAVLRTRRARPGPPPRRDARAVLESARPHAGGPPGRVGRTAQLSLTGASGTIRGCRT